jgi:hypothetical protein
VIPGEVMLDLESEWRASDSAIPVFCAYETLPTRGVVAVDRMSATLGCTGPVFPVNSDHSNLVKP